MRFVGAAEKAMREQRGTERGSLVRDARKCAPRNGPGETEGQERNGKRASGRSLVIGILTASSRMIDERPTSYDDFLENRSHVTTTQHTNRNDLASPFVSFPRGVSTFLSRNAGLLIAKINSGESSGS